MRVLLINPFYPISETPSPPLGLAYLAAALERDGAEVEILDLVVTPYSRRRLAARLRGFAPQVVGATAVTMTFDAASAVLADVKRCDPKVLTVMGGPHVTFRAAESLRENPHIDAVVLGEGEEIMCKIARSVGNGGNLEAIAGVVYRDDGRIRSNPPRSSHLDFARLPTPARHLLPLARYRTLGLSVSMTTSRGCPHQCIFCAGRKMLGARVRYRRLPAIVDEMEMLAGMNFPQINLADDLFTASQRHCLGVCDEILRRGLRVRWTSFARVDSVSKPLLEKMRAAGCTAVSFGVETGSPEMLRRIRKGITLEQVRAAARICRAAGVTAHASFILGLPGESPASLQATLEFARELEDLGVSYGYHLLAPFPGTRVRDQCRHYDLHILTDDWRCYHANRAITETSRVKKHQLDEIAAAWEKRFDDYLADLAEGRRLGEATEEEIRPLVGLERTVDLYELMMGRVIERLASWPQSKPHLSSQAAAADLTARIGHAVKGPRPRVQAALTWALETGGLQRFQENGKVRFAWRERI